MVSSRRYRQRTALLGPTLMACLLALPGHAQTVHALVVADTKDPILYTACKRDVETMHRQFVQLAAAIHYRLHEQVLAGDEFTQKRLNDVIRTLEPGPDDILFLYYTGHGYNASQRAGRFPVLFLEKKAKDSQQNPGLLSIHETLKAKKARLCITMGDCCNQLIPNMRGMIRKAVKPKPLVLTNDSLNAVYRTLFLDVKGDALIASSRPPEQACAHPDSGSFYTRSFDEALELAGRYNQTVTWETLLRDAQTRLTRHKATRSKQSIYEVNVDKANINQTTSLARTPLTVTIRTNKGRVNVQYREGDQLIIEAKANRPCHVRLVYVLADGTKALLETDYEIKPGQENGYVRIRPDLPLQCSSPFGTEYLLVYAAEEAFCPVPQAPNQTVYLRKEDGYDLFVGSTTEVIKASVCTGSGMPVAEDRIQITTRSLN